MFRKVVCHNHNKQAGGIINQLLLAKFWGDKWQNKSGLMENMSLPHWTLPSSAHCKLHCPDLPACAADQAVGQVYCSNPPWQTAQPSSAHYSGSWFHPMAARHVHPPHRPYVLHQRPVGVLMLLPRLWLLLPPQVTCTPAAAQRHCPAVAAQVSAVWNKSCLQLSKEYWCIAKSGGNKQSSIDW